MSEAVKDFVVSFVLDGGVVVSLICSGMD